MDSKYDTKELIYKTGTDTQTQKTNLELPKGGGGRRHKLRAGDSWMHTTIYKIDKQQGPMI